MDGVLQLQRRAYEYSGQGKWTNVEKEIPVTDGRETLGDLKDSVIDYQTVKIREEKEREGDAEMLDKVVTVTSEEGEKRPESVKGVLRIENLEAIGDVTQEGTFR